jgi:xylulokinase
MGVTQGAGLSLRWFRDQFGVLSQGNSDGDPYDSLTAEAASVAPGADGLLWAPYLMGERTPHLDPDARAVLAGLTASHTRAHIVRAILEGVAFSLKDSFEILRELNVPCDTIRLGGGGARSELWRQIQADVYDHEVETVAAEEGAAYGVALLAGVAAGAWSTVDAACDEVIRTKTRVQPDPDAVAIFHRQYRKYVALYPTLRTILNTEGTKCDQ